MKNVLAVIVTAIGLAGCQGPYATEHQTMKTKVASSAASVSSDAPCQDMTHLYFCDDFNSQDHSNWKFLATKGGNPDGQWDIPQGSGYLRYTAGRKGGEILLASDQVRQKLPKSGNYFIEAKIRPRKNSSTYNKQLYLMGRWQSKGNWYGGGLNLQNSSSSTKVEIAYRKKGSVTRPIQVSQPLFLGRAGGTDGTWYTTRLEMIDNVLTIYMNGKKYGSYTDKDKLYHGAGNIGIWTNNRSFEIDYIKVGNPKVKPAQLTLDYTASNWSSIAHGKSLILHVKALQPDGKTADSFSVHSTAPEHVVSKVNGNKITLMPKAKGKADIIITSGSNPSLSRVVHVDVAKAFKMPTATYGSLAKIAMPAPNSTGQYVDTDLQLTFDKVPTLGKAGQIRVYRAKDNKLVDMISLASEIDALGYKNQKYKRYVKYAPVTVQGKTIHVKLHNSVLNYATSYYIAVGDGAIKDTTLNGKPFVGLGVNSQWRFTTKVTHPTGNQVRVGKDQGYDFSTIQGAFNYVMKHVDPNTGAKITIAPGLYHEMLYLRGMNKVTVEGATQNPEDTVISYDNYETFNPGTGYSETVKSTQPGGGRSLFLAEKNDLLTLKNLTIRNSHQRNRRYANQAETIYFKNKAGRLIAYNAQFFSEQDTLLLSGYTWFYKSLVAGNVDFIWGYSHASLFENSEIRSLGDSSQGKNKATTGGYVLQARVPNKNDVGFVFLNSQFTQGSGPNHNTIRSGTTYLARSGGSKNYYDNIVMINSRMGNHIAGIGWAGEHINGQPAPNPSYATANAGWREYDSHDLAGHKLNLSNRKTAYVLTDPAQITPYDTRDKVFSAINWHPVVPH